MSNYKTVKGKKLDKDLLDLAEKAVSGKGDGRISLSDAKMLFDAVKKDGTYSDIEKKTMEYIRDQFKFTESGDKWFRTEIRKWASTKKPSKKLAKAPVPKQKKETDPEPIADEKEETIPLIEEIKGTEAVIPPPTIPRMEAVPEHIHIPHEEKKKFPWVWILLLILLAIFLFFFWKGCIQSSKEPKQSVPQVDAPAPEKIKETLPDWSWEDLEKTKFGFQKGLANLSPESLPTLDKIVSLLEKDSKARLKIIGHSCDTGSEKTNERISLQRAESVKTILIEKGIESTRIEVEGRGQSEPITENDTEENRAKNRRVEFRLIKNDNSR
jgi:outer membrane protein OmpA-like peptidoglycan-associated protein